MRRLIEDTLNRVEKLLGQTPVDRTLVSTAYLQLTSLATTFEERTKLRMLRDAATPEQLREAVIVARRSFGLDARCTC